MKNRLLVVFLLIIGGVNAQEEVEGPPPPVPPKTVLESKEKDEKGDIIDFPAVEYPGGTIALSKYIQDNCQYPEISRELGDEGRVYVTFIVEHDYC